MHASKAALKCLCFIDELTLALNYSAVLRTVSNILPYFEYKFILYQKLKNIDYYYNFLKILSKTKSLSFWIICECICILMLRVSLRTRIPILPVKTRSLGNSLWIILLFEFWKTILLFQSVTANQVCLQIL